jgi:GntR family transcriptional regulator/MocR family aminotransferase
VEIGSAEAGLHILVRFSGIPSGLAGSVAEAAALQSVGLTPAEACPADDPDAVAFLMGFAGLDTAELENGVALLHGVIASFRRR